MAACCTGHIPAVAADHTGRIPAAVTAGRTDHMPAAVAADHTGHIPVLRAEAYPDIASLF